MMILPAEEDTEDPNFQGGIIDVEIEHDPVGGEAPQASQKVGTGSAPVRMMGQGRHHVLDSV